MQLGSEQKQALEATLRGRKHIFLTGEAGVGKSHLIHEIKNTLPDDMLACVAPTGVAAVNIGGTTIHSFCHITDIINPRAFPLDDEEKIEAYEKIRFLIIDEVFMCRSDLVDLIDLFLRMNGHRKGYPFGGVQLIMVGDPYQLPPVVTDSERERFGIGKPLESPHFFDAIVWQDAGFRVMELKEKFRFDNAEWPDLLGRLRIGMASSGDLKMINQASGKKPDTDSTRLYARNAAVDAYNDKMLSSLRGAPRVYDAEIGGEVRESYRPTLEKLHLKAGARVVCLRNGTDTDTRADYQNGSMGYVAYMDDGEVGVDLDNGNMISLKPATWEIPSYDRRFAHFPSNLLKSLDRGFPKSVMRSLQPIDFRGLIKMTEPWGITYGSPIFRVVREKRCKAFYTLAKRNPRALKSALAAGSEPSNGDRPDSHSQ